MADPIEDAKKYSEILTKILNKKDDDKVSKSIKKIKKLNSEILKFFSNKKSYEAFIEIFESNHKNLRKWKKLNKQINVLNYHNFRQILDILEFYENLPNLHEIEQHLKEGFTDKCEKLKKKIESAGITIKEEQKTDEQFKQEINTFFEEEAKIKSNKETKMSKGWKYIRNKLLHKNYDELD
ncbi:hypothetical protein Mgra_00007626 [Meloidogyne graminicola]|uniref:Uncharacterized protein n=1 Tax=Meloidogyne graminicola TaxID=189291 RepID=A0A8S9ZI81_9BILA|nr:hypothetical protein Mgra_00007626 [Meloidogyne graminicola]